MVGIVVPQVALDTMFRYFMVLELLTASIVVLERGENLPLSIFSICRGSLGVSK